MTSTRRDFLETLALGLGGGLVTRCPGVWAKRQGDDRAVVARIEADLEQHAAFGDKFSGGPGDLATARWVEGRLQSAGYEVEWSEFDAPFFVSRTTKFRVGQIHVDVSPQAPVVPTGPGGVSGGLALVEEAAGDVRNRIAVIVTPFGRHAALFAERGIGRTVRETAAAGARAIVIVTMGPSGEAVALNAPEEPFVPVPTAILAPKNAARVIEAARRAQEATLVLDGEATHRPSPNIIGRLRQGDQWIAISTPRSGWYGCVAERGTGTAAFLELAGWAPRRFPNHSVFVMNTGGHEYFFAGSHRIIDQAPPPADTEVWVHVGATLAARDAEERDGRLVMLDTADPQRNTMATENARDAVMKAFQGLTGLEQPGTIRAHAGELSTFTDRGYKNAFAVIGVHRWFHTVADTLKTVRAELVVPVLRAHQHAIEIIVTRA